MHQAIVSRWLRAVSFAEFALRVIQDDQAARRSRAGCSKGTILTSTTWRSRSLRALRDLRPRSVTSPDRLVGAPSAAQVGATPPLHEQRAGSRGGAGHLARPANPKQQGEIYAQTDPNPTSSPLTPSGSQPRCARITATDRLDAFGESDPSGSRAQSSTHLRWRRHMPGRDKHDRGRSAPVTASVILSLCESHESAPTRECRDAETRVFPTKDRSRRGAWRRSR